MPLDLTFKQVCELIKKDDPKLIEAVDKLLGLALLCSPAIIGPAAAAALPPMIAVKNEIMKISSGLFKAVTSKKDDDYLARQQRMEIAYGLICFTAFFEALDRQIPEPLRERIGLLKGEKISFVKSAQCKRHYPHETSPIDLTMVAAANSPAALAAPFPHPAKTLTQQIERNAKIWKQMAEGFRDFVQNLAFWEKAQEKEQMQILAGLDKVPQVAAKCFEAQYFELARRYEDFAVWADLQEHKKTKALIGSLSEYVQK